MANSPRVLAIIQARMNSSRLPGKSMADLGGHPVIWHLFRQLESSSMITQAILATTTNPCDNELAQFGEEQGWGVFRGNETDVLGRYYEAAKAFGADEKTAIIRLTGDDVFPDPLVIDALTNLYVAADGAVEVVCTERTDRFPYGTGIELFSFKALTQANQEAELPDHREHVSDFIFDHPSRFPKFEVVPSRSLEGFPLSIDTAEDLERNRVFLHHMKTFAKRPYSLADTLTAMKKMIDTGYVAAEKKNLSGEDN